MKTRNDRLILFFVKYPEEGKVKKRLSPFLDDGLVVQLYRNFVLDHLCLLQKLELEFWICFHPGNEREKFNQWLGSGYTYVPQSGRDLGERMKNAFSQAFSEGYNQVILMGSDIPDLPAKVIQEALFSLLSHDAVIGPSQDGGYYLIGFCKNTFLPDAFKGIQWSTEIVFQRTVDILKGNGLEIHLLPTWSDVDTFEDLKALFQMNQDTEFRRSRTMAFISEHVDILP